jgi:hypothetical protein
MSAVKWYVLIHQLPPKPLYLRAKIRNRLARVGALALKNSVYVLPARDECLEDFQWIAQEAVAGGGEAFVCASEFVEGTSDEALVRQFKALANDAYAGLRREVAAAIEKARTRGKDDEGRSALLRLRKRLEDVAGADFFGAPARKEVETMLRALETRLHGRTRTGPAGPQRPHPDLVGRVWVTRRGPKVDRLASAWLIRRFVDPGARFRFIDPQRESLRGHEVGFDMPGGRFSHEGDRCTFETLAAHLRVRDPAVRAIGEIVHDLDLKDARYARPEAEGVRQLVLGLVRAHPDDGDRLERGLALFDDLFASYAGRPAASPSAARRAGASRNKQRSRRARPGR